MTAIFAAMSQGLRATLSDQAIMKDVFANGSATATYKIDNDGTARDHDEALLETWLQSGAASSYEVRATVLSGTSPTGSALATWLNCGSDRSWSQNSTGGAGSVSGIITVEIRSASSLIVLATATITINAISEP